MRLLVWGIILAGLAACSDAAEPTYSGRCPTAAVVSDTSKIVKYQGDGRAKPENVVVAAEILFAEIGCRFDANGLDAALVLDIRAQVGPATREFNHVLPIYIAITDQNDRVLIKKIVGTNAGFSDSNTVAYTDVIEGIRIPLAEGDRGSNYKVLAGFQLTRQQLAQNRERFGFRQ